MNCELGPFSNTTLKVLLNKIILLTYLLKNKTNGPK